MEQVETTLTRSVFVFITYTQTMTTTSRPKKAQKTKEGERVSRSKGTSKEIRMLSSLTLNLEQFELHLYQLYSKFKVELPSSFLNGLDQRQACFQTKHCSGLPNQQGVVP